MSLRRFKLALILPIPHYSYYYFNIVSRRCLEHRPVDLTLEINFRDIIVKLKVACQCSPKHLECLILKFQGFSYIVKCEVLFAFFFGVLIVILGIMLFCKLKFYSICILFYFFCPPNSRVGVVGDHSGPSVVRLTHHWAAEGDYLFLITNFCALIQMLMLSSKYVTYVIIICNLFNVFYITK